MMIEYAPGRFPLRVKLRGGADCLVRPIGRRDATRLRRFFLAVPRQERLSVKQAVFDRSLFDQWCRYADFERHLPLVLLRRNQIVAQASLHQRLGGWKRHIGLITFLAHPRYGGGDAAGALLVELIETARALGLRRLEAEFNGERAAAIRALKHMGFRRLLRLPRYVLDLNSGFHDYVLLGMELK